MSARHPLAGAGAVTLETIRNESFIFVTPHSDKMPPGYRLCQDEGFTPQIACVTDERMVMLSIMKESCLVSVVPEQDADAFTRIGDFSAFLIDSPMDRNIVLSIPASKDLSKIGAVFLRELLELPEIRGLNPGVTVSNWIRRE